MGIIRHAHQSTLPDIPGADVGADEWNADHVITAESIVHGDIAAANKDGLAATPSMRTLGTGAQQAAAGDHDHAGDYQPADADLTAIAALTSTGLVERTGAGTAAIRVIGAASGASIPTRDDADARYSAIGHTHLAGDVSGLGTAALVNTGTNSGNVPTVDQADARYAAAGHTHAGAMTLGLAVALAAGIYTP